MNKSEDIKNSNFFEENKSDIEAFAKELINKKYAHRDIEDIAKKARASYAIELQKDSSKKFDLKYLKDAVETKGETVGAIEGEEVPAWLKGMLNEDIETPKYTERKKRSFLKRLLNL